MKRRQATHYTFKLIPGISTAGWQTFLNLWHERFGEAPVLVTDLIEVFWAADMPHVILARTSRQTVSVINRLLWNGRDINHDGWRIEFLGRDSSQRCLYRLTPTNR